MIQRIILIMLFIAAIGLCYRLFRSLVRSKQLSLKPNSPLILPDDFLLTIMLFFNLWICLLFLLISHNLSLHDKQNIIIISVIFTPFLFWWWHKKSGRKS